MGYREPSPEIGAIAADLIATRPAFAALRDSGVAIAFLTEDTERTRNGKAVLGECEKVPAKYRWSVPFDFTVTIYTPNTERLGDDQMRILVMHELMHIGAHRDGNEWVYGIIPHDIEDFREILDRYGLDWSA